MLRMTVEHEHYAHPSMPYAELLYGATRHAAVDAEDGWVSQLSLGFVQAMVALSQLEWTGHVDGWTGHCPECSRPRKSGHDLKCKLGKILEGVAVPASRRAD